MTRIAERLTFADFQSALTYCEQKGFRVQQKTSRHAVLRTPQKRAEIFCSAHSVTVHIKLK